ncbi:MAG: TssQ family T6SS-associated lipoprotein [Pseudomonadota bacterium]
MKISRSLAALPILLSAALLAGCANPLADNKPAPARPAGANPARAPAAAALPADQLALREGVELYNNGKYNEAIKRLSGNEINSASTKELQLDAIKHVAFSYCVTQRQTLCKLQFDKALKLDPAFNLAPGEIGHPLWTPVFLKAKKGK